MGRPPHHPALPRQPPRHLTHQSAEILRLEDLRLGPVLKRVTDDPVRVGHTMENYHAPTIHLNG